MPPQALSASPKGLRIIAALKLTKGILLAGIALGLFRAINHDLGETTRKIAAHLKIDPENHVIRFILEKVTNIDPKTLRTFGLISLLYATELLLEGIGLWFNQAWAKYLVVVATVFFVPEEIYASLKHFTWERIGLLVVNLAVFYYVMLVLWHQKSRKKDLI